MLELITEKRDVKTSLKGLRNEGKVPAVFYGRKHEATPISISLSDFKKVVKEAGESTVVNLQSDGKEYPVLIHEVAYHPVTDEPIHADFYVIEADKPVEVNVPIEFIGLAPAEKEEGGIVVKVLHEVLVRGLPKDLPQNIEVDLEALKTMDDHIALGNLKLPQGIEVVGEKTEIVASMTVVKEEVEETPEFDADAVVVEEKGKEEKEGEEGKAQEEST